MDKFIDNLGEPDVHVVTNVKPITNNVTAKQSVIHVVTNVKPITNDVLELIEIMTPFIDMMYDSEIVHSIMDKIAKKKFFYTNCDAHSYKQISKSLAQFLHAVVYYEYFENLSPEFKNGLTDKQTKTFEQIKKLSPKKSVDSLTKLISFKLGSTNCTITNKFISDLKSKASQPIMLTEENISTISNINNSSKNTGDNSTNESVISNNTLNDVNRITLTESDYTESEINSIITYVDEVTSIIIPIDSLHTYDLSGGKMQTRRKKLSKTLRKHKQTLRKNTTKKHVATNNIKINH